MKFIGHRGASGYEPENTMASFQKALEGGVDAIELDVHALKTGELVVIHDDKVNRTTNGTGYVMDYTFDQLRQLNAGNGQIVPTLDEVILLVDKKIPINIELKGLGTATAVAKSIDDYRARGWVDNNFIVSSFNHVELQEFKSLQPSIDIGALIVGIPTDYAAFAEKLQAFSVNPSSEFITPAFVSDAHRRNLEVYVFTVNDQSEVKRMQSLGVDAIFSNFPDKVRGYLN